MRYFYNKIGNKLSERFLLHLGDADYLQDFPERGRKVLSAFGAGGWLTVDPRKRS